MESPFIFEVIHEVQVPDGVSEQGQNDILEYLEPFKLVLPADWDWRWLNKQGALTKRFEKEARAQGKTLPAKMSQLIGETAQMHCVDPTTYYLKYTRALDWEHGDFGDENSCFWGGRSAALKMLKHHGAHAVQFFCKDGKDFKGIGRCFAYELDVSMQVLFNAYGLLSMESSDDRQGRKDANVVRIAQIVALQTGIGQYRSVSLLNDGASEGSLYINSASGWVVGPSRLIRNIAAVDLHLKRPGAVLCVDCGIQFFTDDDPPTPLEPGKTEHTLCRKCIGAKYELCRSCMELTSRNELLPMNSGVACKKCRSSKGRKCHTCNYFGTLDRLFFIEDEKTWTCRDCLYRLGRSCFNCHKPTLSAGEYSNEEGQILCVTCGNK